MSSGWKLPCTIIFQFHRKKLAYLKYPRIDSERRMENHINDNLTARFRTRAIILEMLQSTKEVAISIRKKSPLDL